MRITVSDSKLTDTIDVRINVTDVDENRAPSFAEGNRATRSVAENTGSGQDIGSAVSATDPDNDTLTYTLGGTDAESFSIDGTNGQLKTKAALDYETKTFYTVRITVSDSKLTDTIDVRINVTDINENRPPVFTDGSSTTRAVAENTGSGQNIGSAVAATDPNTGDTLTYTLGGADAAAFSIDGTNGQLQTKAALDHEAKSSYSVRITVSDTKLTDTIDVTINVTNVNEAPNFTEGSSTTRAVAENTAADTNIGSAVSATDPDTGDTLTYTLGGADAASFSINTTNGQLQTSAALDYETKPFYSVLVSVSDGNGASDSIAVRINVTDVDETPANRAPIFTDGASTTRSIAENSNSGTDIGTAIAASDADDDTLTYTLGGADAESFSINGTNGQLQTKAALDYETKISYTVTITVSDSKLTDTIDVTISVTNVNEAPSFATNTATRSVPENTNSGENIGAAFTATDVDTDDTLTYTLGGADAASFSINGTNGQLQTKAALDHETKASYSVTITVSDTKLTDSIDVTIDVTNVNEAPSFANSTATRAIPENTGSGEDIGAAVTATDPDTDDTLTYTLDGTDASSFSIVSTSGQLQTNVALDHETKASYSVTVTATDSDNLSDTTTVTINVTNVNEAPNFTEGSSATRAIAENTASETNIGSAVSATDPDNDTLTYTLGGTDAESFSIDNTNGQLQTSAALDYEAKPSYSVRITVSDTKLTDTIDVTINVTDADENRAPSFAEGTSTTRAVAENTTADTNIGSAVAATDPDDDTLTYTLSGADAASFSIDGTNGQLQTKAALDHETKASYTVRITVSDTKLTDTIDVTISVTDVNEAPSFATNTATRSIPENTNSGENIGAAFTATDVDTDDTLTYTLGGADAESFRIDGTNGQLQTKAALDHETKASYSVTITVSDTKLTDSIDVTIDVTNVNEAPSFANSTATRAIPENTASGEDIGAAVVATDPDTDDTLTYTLDGTDADSFSIVNTSGQLQTKVALDHETKASYSVTVTATDGDNLSDTTTITISVTNVNEAPSFTEGSTAIRSVAENTAAGTDIGSAVTATDVDANTTLTYTLGGVDAASFSINGTNGQLQTSAALDYETKTFYSVLVSVSDGNDGSDSIAVRINVTDVDETPVNRAPTFMDGPSTTRSIAENSNSGIDIGAVIAASDADDDTLTYSLGGKDAVMFSIDGTNGQLQTKAALDHEAKSSYSVIITVSDTKLTDTIDVTISVMNVNEAPNFATDTATRSIPENTTSGENIGAAFTATDVDTDDTLTYTLGGTDAASFSIDGTNGQLQTKAALDHETKASYSVTITVSDTKLTDAINVTISVTDINEAPSFATNTATRSIAENTTSGEDIGAAVVATDPDTDDTLTYTLDGTDADSFSIVNTSGQLQTKIALDHETKASYSVTVTATDGDNLSDTTTVTISVTNVNEAPIFATNTATRSVPENTGSGENIGAAFTATDVDTDDTLTYTIGGADAAAFNINGTNGQLQTKAALDHETKPSYSVRITVSDSKLTDTIDVTISVTDVNEAPNFATNTATRAIPENTASGENIGAAFTATDVDTDDTLTYTIGGADATAFSIDGTNGQLQTKAALDHETKASYSVTVTATDGDNLSDTTTVTISVTNVNEAPSFTEGSTATRSIAENKAAGTNVGAAFTATDVDANTTLTYSLSGTDAATFRIVSTNGQLKTKAALNYETKPSYSVTITVSDGEGSTDTIDVTIDVTDVYEPIIHRTKQVQDAIVAAVPGVNHPDYVTVAHLAAIISLDLSNKSITSLKSGDFNELPALINLFLGDNSISDISDISVLADLTTLQNLSLDDNSISDISALAGLTKLTALSLNGNSINDISTLAGLTKLTHLRLDGNSISDISALAGLTKLQNLRLDGNSISDISALSGLTALIKLSLDDNSISNISALAGLTTLTTLYLQDNSISNISALAGLTTLTTLDLDGNSISNISALSGLTALTTLYLQDNSIRNISALAGLTTLTTLNIGGNPISDYEPLRKLLAAIAAIEDHPGLTLDINMPPVFTEGTSTTRAVPEDTASYQDIGDPVSATDVDNDSLTYSLGGLNADAFSIVPQTGQLQTKAALDYETKTSYSVTMSVSDGNGGTDSIAVTINVTDVNDALITPPVNQRTQEVRDFIIGAVPGVWSADDVTSEHLAAITRLEITHYGITSLKSGDFNGLTGLTYLDLQGNSISDISMLSGLTALTYLNLSENSITDISALRRLTSLTKLHLNGNSISDISALAGLTALTDLNLSENSISNISALRRLTALTDLNLSENSITDISALSGLTALTDLNLSENSISNIWPLRGLTALKNLSLKNNSISNVSALEGLTALKDLYLESNPISNYDPLHKLLAAIAAIEDHPGLTLDITIPPVFTDGTSTTRAVAEYTPSGKDIGDPVSATDVDSEYLTYSLEGTDADSFSIDTATGQLQTSAALNYQTKNSYSVTVSVSDDYNNTDSITVTINVTDVNEAGITPVNQRTQEVQNAIMGAVPVWNADEVTPAHLAAIESLDLSHYNIPSLKSGDFSGLPALTSLSLNGNSISNISMLSGLTALEELRLNSNSISDISVLRGLTKLKKLNLSENSISNIWPLSGLTALTELNLFDNSISTLSPLERLTALTDLKLSGNPISNYDPLRRLTAAIAEIEGHTGLTLDINIPPVFTEGTHTRRSVAEYTLGANDIGDPVSATDANSSDTLTYTLEGTDADAFSIDSSTGQLQTSAALNYQTKRSYSVTISVSDGNEGTDSINVTIYVTDINEALIKPVNQRTQVVQDAILNSVPVDSADEVTVEHLVAITYLNGLSYAGITSLKSGDFSGLFNLTSLSLDGNSISDISPLADLTNVTSLSLSNNSISNIWTLARLTSLKELNLYSNLITNVSALEGLKKLTSLSLWDNLITDYAPLRRLKKTNPDISIDVDIENNPPQFTNGDRTTRSVAENTRSYIEIGEPIPATDADPEDTLTYSFAPEDFRSGDEALFLIGYWDAVLMTKGDLDYEERTSYTVVVDVTDGRGGRDRITVTINVTDVAGAAPSAETSSIIPNQTALLTNFPNPFNPETWIPYQLAKPAEVTLTLYDIRGVVVRELKLGHQPAGIYHNRSRAIHWDGRNAFGEKVATGVYFYTLKAGDFTATRKLLIRK